MKYRNDILLSKLELSNVRYARGICHRVMFENAMNRELLSNISLSIALNIQQIFRRGPTTDTLLALVDANS